MRRILFYKFPISKTTFVQTIIPSLKDSLSLTLKHYISLAGNVVCPPDLSGYPELRYRTGDSVSVTFSESDMDFNFLVGNNPRNTKDFYHFIPQLAEPKDAPGVQLAPILAIQVTLFPNHGISIGSTHHHVAGDGASFAGSVIKDPHGVRMSIWDEMKKYKLEMCDIVTPPDKVRATFIVARDDIVKLKNIILSKRPSLTHVTSFTVTCAYVWTCLIKSEAAIGEEIDENEMELFLCAADCRARLDPPLPPTYFGNCIVPYIVKTSHANVAGKEGFIIAAELIGENIKKKMKDEESILNGECLKELKTTNWNRTVSVAGSPKLDFYAADFGWGRPEKLEFVSIDNGDGVSMSLSKSKDSDEDLEIGLSLSKTRMNAFAAIFTHGLNFL
ncbi:malonyl-coenzyme:anthocyanin 5-o-glucoside-6'''-o-malonyltransferase [Nicotiana attenuata]|uniref:Malonyl-coenzyme:anthocyanin 5-o-glucoside-6'''-o-malonyltransferase n=1 Tax=Nicotiana attenuata TaxID=49451 RepID=A0A314LEA1_NICAT|nr:malonyl-coenzyme:anthocyanin 5-o-glucoside-6'''-o-malonyltransferase [Nicotiana attenuata]